MSIKIDLAKAYHRVDWYFLKDTFYQLRPKPTMRYVSKTNFSILQNGKKLPSSRLLRI